jgi:DNA modification methylase
MTMKIRETQLTFNFEEVQQKESIEKNERLSNGNANKLNPQDRTVHDWYRFVLSFPPHLVRDYLTDFGLEQNSVVLDPFCGTGTTLVEAKLQGVKALGLEAHPFVHFAATTKLNWDIDPDLLLEHSQEIALKVLKILENQGLSDESVITYTNQDIQLKRLEPDAQKLLLKNSISEIPLHKTLILLDVLKNYDRESFYAHSILALANALVYKISNLHFGPEVGVRKIKKDVPIVANWLIEVEKIVNDLKIVQGKTYPASKTFLGDSREIGNKLEAESVDAVITSPPYPNEKDYTRTTRLETVLLGYAKDRSELRKLKKNLVRSNTRGVYKDDDDDRWVIEHPEIQRIADAIEKRRVELGKESGFEKLYARVTKLYFGGMARHLSDLRPVLRPDARLAYVVGDQASYLRIKIKTGEILADIAETLGYKVERIDLFRTRLSTATKEQLREEVVVLRWKGKG